MVQGAGRVGLGSVRGGIPPSLRLVDAIAALMGSRGRDRAAREGLLCVFFCFFFVFVL